VLEFKIISTGEEAGSWWKELPPELQAKLEKEMAERQARGSRPTFSPWLPPINRLKFPAQESSFTHPH